MAKNVFPMKGVTPNGALTGFIRTTSCFGEPSESALTCLKNNDLSGLTSILADVSPVADGQTEIGKHDFPLPEEHWVNARFGVEERYRTLLLVAVELGQIDSVKALLSAGARADLHSEELGVSPLHVAVEDAGIGIVKLLLEYLPQKPMLNKADVNAVNRSGQTALHLAAAKNKADILRFLVRCPDLDDMDPRDLLGGQTPLYLAARNGHAECAEVLIAHGADTAARVGGGRSVRSVLAEHLPHLDPGSIKVVGSAANKSKSMNKGGWDRGDHLSRLMDRAQMNVRKGFSNSYNALEFKIHLSQLTPKELNVYDAAGLTLFQKAATFGLHLHIEHMLDHGMDPTAVCGECSTKPVLLAAYNGYHKVLEVLKNHKANASGEEALVCFSDLEKGSSESVLHWALKKSNPNPRDPNIDYQACFDSLMEEGDPIFNLEINRIVNHKDEQGNSPLHYATQLWNQSVVRKLLERGANIGIKNLWEETPIALIMPETMQSFLDDYCLRYRKEVTHEDFELEFNYSFLAPPIDDPKYDETDPEGREIVENAALPETESLWYMSQSKQHRHLLNHPVIMSFLWLKWQRIRGYFNRNLRFYLMFVMCLSWYIFERFGGIRSRATEVTVLGTDLATNASFCSSLGSRRENGYGFWYFIFVAHTVVQAFLILRDWRYDCFNCNARTCVQMCFTGWLEVLIAGLIVVQLILKASALWWSLTILMVFLMLREVFQMTASLKRYFLSLENWLEIAMIAIVGVVLWLPDSALANPCSVKRHLSAVAIILSWAELITLVARHPRLSRYNIYVTMFYRVLQTFFAFLVWYSFFIVAFALGFYIMLHTDVDPAADLSGEEYPFFNSPWLALVKTSTMFVGEIEFSDIPIPVDAATAPVGYLFLLAFVFLIVVVLMNLLNGLAVSDTGRIREQAQIVSAISRVDTISYIESLMLGDPFDFLSNWPPFALLKSVPSLAFCRCLYRHPAVRDISHKITGATGILLFYSMLPTKTLVLHPNKRTHSCLSQSKMSHEVIAASKAIIVRKEEERRWADERITLEKQVEDLTSQVQGLEVKLDKIMGALRIK